uniref:Acyl_transf_3 domain-containing protein n=1 Tax=Mesocestoides corti TaxID=53468 RepID=A0A5K3FWE1_MESCO
MIQTQKLSSLAFNLSDGVALRSGKDLTKALHKLHSVQSTPKLLPFFGYLLCFQNVIVGPFFFYSDYLCYIEGREEDLIADDSERDIVVKHKEYIREAKVALKKQAFFCVFHFILAFYASGRFVPEFLTSDDFVRLGIFRKYFWLTVYGFYLRQRFYCAWSLSALAMLISGFGFSGFTSNGTLEPEYRNAVNVRFFGIELGTNTKVIL